MQVELIRAAGLIRAKESVLALDDMGPIGPVARVEAIRSGLPESHEWTEREAALLDLAADKPPMKSF